MAEISSEEPKYDLALARRILVMGKPISDSLPGMPVNRTLLTLRGMREIYQLKKDGKNVIDSEGKVVACWIWQGDVRQAIILQNRIVAKAQEIFDHARKTLEEMKFLQSRLQEYSDEEEFHVGKKEIKDE